MRAAACPQPLLSAVKNPGVPDAKPVARLDEPADVVTVTVAERIVKPGPVSDVGTCALICPDETKLSGAGTPLIVTEVPASVRGSGADADACPVARFLPKIAISDPGEIVSDHDAAFTTP